MKTLTTVLLLAAALTAQAQWTRTSGPEGGDIRAITAGPEHTVALLQSGELFRFDRQGERWNSVGRLYGHRLETVGAAIVAETDDGLMLTRDGGEHWVAVGPSTTLRILYATGDTLLATDASGMIWRMTDESVSWEAIAGLGPDIQGVAASGSYLVASIYDESGVRRSTDNGATWTRGGDGLPREALAVELFIHGSATYASMVSFDPFQNHGVYRSDDSGRTWHEFNYGLRQTGGGIPYVAEFFSQGGRLSIATTGGIYRFGGHPVMQWIEGERVYAHDVATLTGGRALLATQGGVIETTGLVANELVTGMPASDVSDLRSVGGTIIAATGNGIHVSLDRGLTWERPLGGRVVELASEGEMLLARRAQFDGDAIFISLDGGMSWSSVQSNVPRPTAASSIALTSGAGFISLSEVARGEAGGIDWRYGGVYRSLDSGATWTAVNSGLPQRGGTPVPVQALAAVDETILAATVTGLYRSTDLGESWTPVDAVGSSPAVIGLIAHGGEFFVSTTTSVLRSSDMGASWRAVETGAQLRAAIESFSSVGTTLIAREVNPSPTALVYALNGNRLSPINEKLPSGIPSYSFAKLGDRVVLGTIGAGVWLGRLDDVSSVDDKPQSIVVAGAYPNPATSQSTVVFRLAERGDVTVELVDAAGNRVLRQSEGTREAGVHSVELDLSGLGAGAYIYRVQAGEQGVSGRIVKR